jgi:hypothetical protein
VPDLYDWTREQITRIENTVRAADKEHGRTWTAKRDPRSDSFQIIDGRGALVADALLAGAAGLIALQAPEVVVGRCLADRKLLKVHKPRGGEWDPYVCEGCGQAGYCQDWVTEHANDCPVLLAVAEGYGLTEEILAGLDRPEWKPPKRPDQSMMPRALQEAYGDAILRSLQQSLIDPGEDLTP